MESDAATLLSALKKPSTNVGKDALAAAAAMPAHH